MQLLSFLVLALVLGSASTARSSSIPSNDERFKADLLLVVAHPDDETVLGAYLARAIFDEHKRVAVIFGTRGDAGGDEVGQQQAASLAAIREIEGRRALAYFGVSNVWFLDTPDTPGQDVLRSLETWDHGRSLGRVVRYVRLTRPDVVVTWLPAPVAGENHGDHQAAGVLATEAFDLAGDPTAYPEQVTAPRDPRDIGNLTEGLHPWQPKKLYYVTDASHTDFLKGRGPEYSSTEISPAKKVPYEQLAAEECAFHLTQSDSGHAAAIALENHQADKTYLHNPVRFIFGKAYVGSNATSDLFDGILPGSLAYRPAPGFRDVHSSKPVLELGGPWHFYAQFWKAHRIEQVGNLVPVELLAGVSTTVSIPVLIENTGATVLDGKLTVELPSGWVLRSDPALIFHVDAGEVFAQRIVALAPPKVDDAWRQIKLSATAGAMSLGTVILRVQVGSYSLPQ